jgi:ATP-dependent helicase/nuclease subunit B
MRGGAAVATLLRAALGDASCDDRLDWLKGCTGDWPALGSISAALEALEGALRRRGWTRPLAVDAAALGLASARLWEAADGVLERLRCARPQRHAAWLALLAEALEASGMMQALRDDDAGRQVLDALHVDDALAAPFSFGDDERLDLHAFIAWVDVALEDGMFRPEPPAKAEVVITPLERASLRPFAAVVLAGADEKRLGAMPAQTPLLGDALGARLGLPTAAERRDRETLAFAQLLRAPRVILSRRQDDGGEPLAPSPLLERLELSHLKEHGTPLQRALDPRVTILTVPTPVARPLPTLTGHVPESLSASACEALRTCPYRFHALYGLRLREADELDDEVEKRDYGTWLHAVLHRFHRDRVVTGNAEQDRDRLHAIGRDVREEMHLDDAAFLPFVASFQGFVPRYLAWIGEREAGGMRWIDGEHELTTRPDAWGGVAMHGRVDRVDADAPGRALQLIDYKTGSADELIRKARDRLEDTQLAFYGALVAGQSAADSDQTATLSAGYLTLDATSTCSMSRMRSRSSSVR